MRSNTIDRLWLHKTSNTTKLCRTLLITWPIRRKINRPSHQDHTLSKQQLEQLCSTNSRNPPSKPAHSQPPGYPMKHPRRATPKPGDHAQIPRNPHRNRSPPYGRLRRRLLNPGTLDTELHMISHLYARRRKHTLCCVVYRAPGFHNRGWGGASPAPSLLACQQGCMEGSNPPQQT